DGRDFAEKTLKSLTKTSGPGAEPSVEMQRLLEKYKAGQLSPEKAREALKELVDHRITLEREYVRARQKEYVSSAHEIEAWVIGKDAQSAFSGEHPSPSLLDSPVSSKSRPEQAKGPDTKRGVGDGHGPDTQRGLGDDHGPDTQRGLGDDHGPDTQRSP